MGYVFNFQDAEASQAWYENPRNRRLINLQNRLMLDFLRPHSGGSVLDIGCGVGKSLLPFLECGLEVTGVDPSTPMLHKAAKNVGSRALLYRGYAEDLPFDDNSFNYACLLNTLEFVDDPQKALEEACRVAKDKLFVGILNRYALKRIQLKVKEIFHQSAYSHARFFSIWELKQSIRSLAGDVPLAWRTVGQLPTVSGKIVNSFEKSDFIQKSPFGAFAGMVVTLTPRFRTRPLPLPCHAAQAPGVLAC